MSYAKWVQPSSHNNLNVPNVHFFYLTCGQTLFVRRLLSTK